MSQKLNLVVAPTAYQCLQDIESYKSSYIGKQPAADFVDNLFDESLHKICEDPERYRYNIWLQDRGMLLRERLDVDGEYRVLYDFDGHNIEILLFVSMKQDFEKQLYRYNLLH